MKKPSDMEGFFYSVIKIHSTRPHFIFQINQQKMNTFCNPEANINYTSPKNSTIYAGRV